MNTPLDRTLDACVNRASEGLRVLMDVSRFEMEDPGLSDRLKQLRHRLIEVFSSDLPVLMMARESSTDVSRPTEISAPSPPYRDLPSLIEANSRRAEEALRSLEEFSRLTDSTRARAVEFIRYEMYDLHKELMKKNAQLQLTRKMDFELYVVTDSKLSKGRPLNQVVLRAIRGGAGCIQLREKGGNKREILNQALELRRLTREEGVTFIVNDHLDIALEVEADGVHLGQEDLPLESARRLSRGRLLIGISTHTRAQAVEAEQKGAGYINIGPIFPTQTKGVPVHPVTPSLIKEVAPLVQVPITVMGGIHLENVREVVLAGADRIAVVSEVVAAPDIEKAARQMVEEIRRAKEERQSV